MRKRDLKPALLNFYDDCNSEKYWDFMMLGHKKRYTQVQKEYAFKLINDSGLRFTSRVLEVPRCTLQRWCRKDRIFVKRCPQWVYYWVEARRKRKQFWSRHGYPYLKRSDTTL